MNDDQAHVERFPGTGGLLMPVVAGVLGALLLAIALVDGLQGRDLPLAAGCLLGAVVVWVVFLRPSVRVVDQETLVLTGPLSRTEIPLAAVERLALTRMLVVQVAGRRHVSTAVARSMRSALASGGMLATRSGPGAPAVPERPSEAKAAGRREGQPYPDFVEERLARLAENARARRGIRVLSDEQEALAADVRREVSTPAVAALGLSALLFVAALLLV
ncbi:hypothetical protein [uncultured Nocardioides sp.]|uniref:hypothetical protein n=1 Tax=uncultured Nocardioides sp. TaxID=198441 RepID=UPI002639B9ED|nr:hypothetical protein [uncultured Nocardioides sp.]